MASQGQKRGACGHFMAAFDSYIFAYDAPYCWNELPIHSEASLSSFRSKLDDVGYCHMYTAYQAIVINILNHGYHIDFLSFNSINL